MKIVHSPNPIFAGQDRKVYAGVGYTPGDTIADVLIAQGVDLQFKPHALYLNGAHIPLDDWDKVAVTEGDSITLKAYLEGGSGSNPVAAIATIALIVAAPYAAGALVGASSGLGFTLASGAILAGGQILIQALFPPATPKGNESAGVSPTYSFSGASNTARPNQPLPCVIGTHRISPDYDAQPYTYYLNEQQYLCMVFNFGWELNSDPGYGLSLTDFQIGDTSLDEFELVETEVSSNDGELTLFHTNVVTENGAKLEPNADFTIRRTAKMTERIELDFSGVIFRTNKKGQFRWKFCDIQVEYREADTAGAWLPFHATGTTFSFNNGSPNTRRYTRTLNVAIGQYDVRVKRLCGSPGSGETANITWDSIKSFRPEYGSSDGQIRMAVRIKASGQLSGTVQNFSAVAEQRIEAYDGGVSTTLGRNPASQFLAIARGLTDSSGKLVFGAGLPDSRIDLTNIEDWGDWCETNDLKCDFVFDVNRSLGEALTLVARVGRATISWATGKLGVIYDQANQPITQLVAQENMIEGSFEIDYTSESLADEIVVNFINPKLGWKPDVLSVVVPGVTTPVKTANIDIAGITREVQAGKEANLLAARQAYNPRRVSFEMDSEALVSTRGDVVQVSNDLTAWAQSSRVQAFGGDWGSGDTITLETPVFLAASTTYYIKLRSSDGSFQDFTVSTAGADDYESTIDLSGYISGGPPDLGWIAQIDTATTPGRRMKIVDLIPSNGSADRFRVTCVDDSSDYHNSENGSYTYDTPDAEGAWGAVHTINISDVDSPPGAQVTATWSLSNCTGADVYWTQPGSDTFNNHSLNNTTGTASVQVSGNGFMRWRFIPVGGVHPGGSTEIGFNVTASSTGGFPNLTIPDIQNLQATETLGEDGDGQEFEWDAATAEIDPPTAGGEDTINDLFAGYRVDIEVSSVIVHTELVDDVGFEFTAAKNEATTGGPHRDYTVKVYYELTTGEKSATPATLVFSDAAPAAPTFALTGGAGQVFVDITPPADLDVQGYYVCTSTSSGFTPGAGNVAARGPAEFVSVPGPGGSTLYVRVAAYDRVDGIDDLTFAAEQSVLVPETGIPDAPVDDKAYVRKNAAWEQTTNVRFFDDTDLSTSTNPWSVSWTNRSRQRPIEPLAPRLVEYEDDFVLDIGLTHSYNTSTLTQVVSGSSLTLTTTSGTPYGVSLMPHKLRGYVYGVEAQVSSWTTASAYNFALVGVASGYLNSLMLEFDLKTATNNVRITEGIAGVLTTLTGSTVSWPIPTGPFRLAFTMVANTAAAWIDAGTGWQLMTRGVSTGSRDFTLKATIEQYSPVVGMSMGGVDSISYGEVKAGSFGQSGLRDMDLIRYEDMTPIRDGDKFYFTATASSPEQSHFGIYTYDSATRKIEKTGVFYFKGSTFVFSPLPGSIVFDRNAGKFRILMSYWNTISGPTDIWYSETTEWMLEGVHFLDEPTATSIPKGAAGQLVYDPSFYWDGSKWVVGYTIHNDATLATAVFHAALATTTDFSTWTFVGEDASRQPYEGTKIVQFGGSPYLVASSVSDHVFYNMSMTYQGSNTTPLSVPSGSPPHTTIIPIDREGKTRYEMLQFDNITLGASTFTWGTLHIHDTATEQTGHEHDPKQFVPYP